MKWLLTGGGILLTAFAMLKHPLEQKPKALLFLRDVSRSSVHSKAWNHTLTLVCKGVVENGKGATFAVIPYADYAEPSTPQPIRDTLMSAQQCGKVDFEPQGSGTNPRAAVDNALLLVNRSDRAVIPTVILTLHADETGTGAATKRSELVVSMKTLARAIESRHGRLVVVVRSYKKLKADLWEAIAHSKLHADTVQFCDVNEQHPQSTVRCVKTALNQ